MANIDKYLASDMKERKTKVWKDMKDLSSSIKGTAMWSKRYDGDEEGFKEKLQLDIRQYKMNLNRLESLYVLR